MHFVVSEQFLAEKYERDRVFAYGSVTPPDAPGAPYAPPHSLLTQKVDKKNSKIYVY